MILTAIVPLEATFYVALSRTHRTRLKRDVIELNYGHFSPFKAGTLLYRYTPEQLMIWFTELPNQSKQFLIPECYLIYRQFRDKNQAIITLTRNGKINLLVIKQQRLVAALTVQSDHHSLPTILERLKREHALDNPELLTLTPDVRFTAGARDIIGFIHQHIRPSQLLSTTMDALKLPITLALLVSAGFVYYGEYRLEQTLTEKKAELAQLKKNNAPIQANLERLREAGDHWQTFAATEGLYQGFYFYLAKLAEVIDTNGGFINHFDFTEGRISLWTGLKSSEATIIKELLATGLFQDIKLLGSNKDSSKPEFVQYNLELKLKSNQQVTP